MKFKNKSTGEIIDFKLNHINSKSISSQQRNRYYWCNWMVDDLKPSPKALKDVLQPDSEIDNRFIISDKLHTFFKSHCKKRTGRDWFPRDTNKPSVALTARYFKMSTDDNYVYYGEKIRKLTPIECERLQTLKDGYTEKGINEKDDIVDISNTRRYQTIGNGWTVDVIEHIFKGTI